ncbi:hypothetical protein RAA17_14740 [Komagataeibacter rhaeticus]|nr:hypothetical protein [Komagataeibacter rhaeticus]
MDTVSHMPHLDTSSGGMDLLAINTIRTLAIDAIQKANSGHPGTPMGLAPASYVLWRDILKYDPAAPGWINRDRFVLVGRPCLVHALCNTFPGGRARDGGQWPCDRPPGRNA